ncbi:hypothetical protein RND81_11G162300 [Saponaria officinalis]|uniref:Uncharacterized protein n=1 Tax=Saponaria officinalis TaxID=3572 RepID=A0AAW1HMW0_SAPOF
MVLPKMISLGCLVLLLALVEATPPGIANHPAQASCKIKKYKMCYNLVHVCPKFCPDGCEVECASCKPICTSGSTPGGDTGSSPPYVHPPSDESGDNTGSSPPYVHPPSNESGDNTGSSPPYVHPPSDESGDNTGSPPTTYVPPPSDSSDGEKGKGDDKKGKGDDKGKDDDKKGKDDGKKGGDSPSGSSTPSYSPPPLPAVDPVPPTYSPPTVPSSPPPSTPSPSTPSYSPPPLPAVDPVPPTYSPPAVPSSPPPSTPFPSTPSYSPPMPTLSPPVTPPSSPSPKPPTYTPTPPTPSPKPPTLSPPTQTPPSPSPKPPTPSPSSPPYWPPPPVTPSPPTPTPPTPSPLSPVTPTPSSPPPPSTPAPTPPTPSVPWTPSPPPSTPTPAPAPPTPSSPPYPPPSTPWTPPSSGVASRKRVRCTKKDYGACYGQEFTCPGNCPTSCQVDCNSCKPVCSCEYPGAVCQDPRFIGGDGITFYFHGKKDSYFCLVSDSNLHINAHFIGKRNSRMTRDFTWVQSLGILFDNHRVFISALKTTTWDDTNDRLALSLDNVPILLEPTTDTQWRSTTTPKVTVTRASQYNNIILEIEGKMRLSIKVVPISEEESRVHNYNITKEDCFAHLDLGFKFHSLSNLVDGVLGKTYRDDYVSRVKMGVAMPIMGGDKEYATSNLFATDCLVSRFNNNNIIINNNYESFNSMMNCDSGINGEGVVCKR